MLGKKVQSAMLLKVKLIRNSAILNITNSSLETMIFNHKVMLRILDLWSIGCYKTWYFTASHIRYFRIESADVLCEQFGNFVNILKKRNKRKRR